MSLFGAGLPNIEKLKAKHDVRGLVKALTYEGDARVRQQAALALGALKAPQVGEPLMAALQDSDPAVRCSAARALAQLGESHATPAISKLLEDKDPTVHSEAARVLGQIGGAQSVEPLTLAIKRWGSDFHPLAFAALGQIASRSTQRARIIPFIAGMLNDPDPAIGKHTADMLETLGWQPERDEAGATYYLLKGDLAACAEMGPPAVPPLLRAMHAEDTSMRQRVFGVLVGMGANAAEPLMAALDEPEHDMHQAILWALIKIGPPAVEPLLVGLQSHPRPGVREGCARALGQIGDERALEALSVALSDEHLAVREAASTALVRFGAAAHEVLVAALQNPSDDVRWLAANALDRLGWKPPHDEAGVNYLIARGQWDKCTAMGDIALQPLIGALHHWADEIRKGAAWALAHLGASAVEPVIAALKAESPPTRASAAWTLGQLHDQRAVPPLALALQDETSEVRLSAIGALVRLHAPCETMVEALKNEEMLVRKTAAWAVGQQRHRCAVEQLILALQDEATEVRQTVVTALGQIGDERAIQPLLTLVNDPDPEVRAAVAEATERIYQGQSV